ncbi:hypothetical protein SDJN03_15525, partial [Cucurbita argyrosperma subsp. sororia]
MSKDVDSVEKYRKHMSGGGGFVVPVVFDVSVQRYGSLFNCYYHGYTFQSNIKATGSSALDIPFGVAPKERCILFHLTLSTPTGSVRSFLPEEAKLIVDTGGMIHSAILSEVSSSPSSRTSARDPNSLGFKQVKVRAHMFSPCKPSSADEVMKWFSYCSYCSLPQSSPNAANVISVTSSAISGSSPEITSIIMFQPRYVISNACSKDLCYKQKGTDSVIPLAVGEHFHLQWTDTTRELLVSVRYNEPGWQWSGSFIPDQLGDTLVKMRNYITGSSYVLRIEVQNVDVSTDNKIVGNGHGNSGTNLILLSDDDTGYVPYRIDNFSKEVPGERILGSFALDDVQDFVPVCLPSTTGKNERMFHLSVNAEGATKKYRSNPVGSLNKDIGAVTRSERFLQADGSLEPR